MSAQLRRQHPMRTSIPLGILLLARGRADGLRQFGGTPSAFLASLAPLIAFPLVGGVLMLVQGGGFAAVSDLLATLCALLAPPVLSYELARWWKREPQWLRFATALNWCQWVIPLLASVLLMLVYPLLLTVMPLQAAGGTVIFAVAGYGLWLHWFVARHALMISRLRAVLLVVGVNLGTGLLALGPYLASQSGLLRIAGIR